MERGCSLDYAARLRKSRCLRFGGTDLVQALCIPLVENRARSRWLTGSLTTPVLATALTVEGLSFILPRGTWDTLGVVGVECRAGVGTVTRGWAPVIRSTTLAPFFIYLESVPRDQHQVGEPETYHCVCPAAVGGLVVAGVVVVV